MSLKIMVLGKSLCNTAMYFAYGILFLQDIQLTNVGKGGGAMDYVMAPTAHTVLHDVTAELLQ